ncbi:unnamed protein product, partial [Ectocarpus fasciculatus]
GQEEALDQGGSPDRAPWGAWATVLTLGGQRRVLDQELPQGPPTGVNHRDSRGETGHPNPDKQAIDDKSKLLGWWWGAG